MDIMRERRAKFAALGVILCTYAALKIKNHRQRRYKVRPINKTRRLAGNFQYYQKMKNWDSCQFFKYTRMTIIVFEKLLGIVGPSIRRQVRSDGISPEERLVITLQLSNYAAPQFFLNFFFHFRYLSQGTSLQVLAWTFHLGLTMVHKIVHETCQALWNTLSPIYLQTPSTEEEWMDIADGFADRWNFPHCIGALDGKHINIQAPSKSGSLYYNYKHRFSIVLLASCDSTYRFRMVDIGAFGSQSDGGVLQNSVFGKRLEKKDMNLPGSRNLPGVDKEMPYFLVADEAFPLKEYIMRPYPGKNLSNTQNIFNYRLSRARQVIENTFGIMVARWRILKTTINAKVENVDNLVKAIVVLHNFCQTENLNMYCPTGYTDTADDRNGAWRDEETALHSVGRVGANISRRQVYTLRDTLAEYFISEDESVSWQNNMINRGRVLT